MALALGGPGSGPAGVAAAYWLGLTSQVPSTYLAAVPTRVPTPWPGVRFTQRPIGRLLHTLTPSEAVTASAFDVAVCPQPTNERSQPKSATGARPADSGAGWTAVLESHAPKQRSAWLNASRVACASPRPAMSGGRDLRLRGTPQSLPLDRPYIAPNSGVIFCLEFCTVQLQAGTPPTAGAIR